MGVGVGDAICHDVDPGVEFLLAAQPDLHSRWRDPPRLAGESTAEHVFERCEPIASFAQKGADGGVGEVGELDLHRGAAGGEGPLDLIQGGRAGHAAEA